MTDTGFTDAGWSVSSEGETLNQNGETSWNLSDTTTDINNVLTRPGVFLISGTKGDVTFMQPIYCSVDNLSNIVQGASNMDDAYLVYPDYGFRLFQSTGYSGSSSNIYFNTSNSPRLFILGTQTWSGATKRVYLLNYDNIDGYQYTQRTTQSIRIFHRSYDGSTQSYKISGLSGSTT
jgi:hypothetical protein